MRGTRYVMHGAVALAMLVGASFSAHAVDSREDIARVSAKPAVRGGIVFRTYCMLCHGERGDGQARATKLYGQANLEIKARPRDYVEKIIRGGGGAVGRQESMPSWGEELSEEQINDVIEYLMIVTNPVGRGEMVFKTNCILCHGVKGDGKGRASVLFTPPPADLTRSDKNDDYKRMIITMGGKAMGRSEVMPIWGEQLSVQQIDDVVAYLRTIVVTQP
mgnify:CR=1 FL=1